jgi:SM-20-related protein
VPKADFFNRLGLFSVERFLDAETCRRLRTAFHAGPKHAGTVGVRHRPDFVVDPTVRSVKSVDVDMALASNVGDRLLAVKPAIEDFYQLALAGCEPPQFLSYATSDHYTPHRDSRPDELASPTSKVRRISAVIFVNEPSEHVAADHYGGGALAFYDFFTDASGQAVGISLEPSEGLLMTFPSHVLHGVSPVTHGERYTIATWFF